MEKIKNAIGGVIAGFIMIVIGTVLLWWNEGNDVKNIKTIEEARASMVNVASDKVDSNNEGKLISTNGEMNVIDEYLVDTDFNVKVFGTARLVRVVEMYQWVENKETDENDNTHYTYEKQWLTSVKDSDLFNNPSQYQNPDTMPYDYKEHLANEVRLGAFTLNDVQLAMLDTGATYILDQNALLPPGYKVYEHYITNVGNMSAPNVGDVRISFKYNKDKNISILAMQKGEGFAPFESKQGKKLNVITPGLLTGEEMINDVEASNNTLKWVLRIVGILLITIGFTALLSPILFVLSVIPIVGKGISGLLRFIASLIGFAFSLLVIAIAWIRFRPVIGICLLAGVVGIVILIIALIKNGRKKSQAAGAQQQVSVQQQPMVQQQVAGQPQMMQQPQMIQQPQMMQQPVQQVPVQPQIMQQPQMVQQPQMMQQPTVGNSVSVMEQMQQQHANNMVQEQQNQAQQAEQDPLAIFGSNNQ